MPQDKSLDFTMIIINIMLYVMIPLIFILTIYGIWQAGEPEEMELREMKDASCDELYLSYDKCDTTGMRSKTSRNYCKELHIPYILKKC